MIGWPIYGFDTDQTVAVEAEDRELPVVGITANDRLCVACRNAGNLQLQIALIAPEPGHLFVGLLPSGEPGGDAAPLVDGILHQFEANAAGCERGRKTRAVADRQDRRVAGSQIAVDDDAVIHGEPSFVGELAIGDYPDANEDEIGGQTAAIGGLDTGDPAVLSPVIRVTPVPRDILAPQRMCASVKNREIGADTTRPIG